MVSQRADPQAVGAPTRDADQNGQDREKPDALIVMRRQREVDRRAGLITHAIDAAPSHAEAEFSGRQIRVIGYATGSGVDPVLIETFKDVAERDPGGRKETQARVMKFQILAA